MHELLTYALLRAADVAPRGCRGRSQSRGHAAATAVTADVVAATAVTADAVAANAVTADAAAETVVTADAAAATAVTAVWFMQACTLLRSLTPP